MFFFREVWLEPVEPENCGMQYATVVSWVTLGAGSYCHMDVSAKIVVVFPPNHPILIGFSIIFTIHFGGPPLFLGNSHIG